MDLTTLQQLYNSLPWLEYGVRGKTSHPRRQKVFVKALQEWSKGFIQTHTITPVGNKSIRYYASVVSERSKYSKRDNQYIPIHSYYKSTYSVSDMYEVDEKKSLYSWTEQYNAMVLDTDEKSMVDKIVAKMTLDWGIFDATKLPYIQSWVSTSMEKNIWSNDAYVLPIHEKLLPCFPELYDLNVDDMYAYMSALYPYQREKRISKCPGKYITSLTKDHFNDAFSNRTVPHHVVLDLVSFYEKRKCLGGDTFYLSDRAEIIIKSILEQKSFRRDYELSQLILDAWSYLSETEQNTILESKDPDYKSFLYPILHVAKLAENINPPKHPNRDSIQDIYGWVHIVNLSPEYFRSIATVFENDPYVKSTMIYASFMNVDESFIAGKIGTILQEWRGFSMTELDALIRQFQTIIDIDQTAMPNVNTLKSWFVEALPEGLKTSGFFDSGVLDTFFQQLRPSSDVVNELNRADHLHNLSSLRGLIVAFSSKAEHQPCELDISMIL